MGISEVYFNLFSYLDRLMSIEFHAFGFTFSLWGMFLCSCLLTFLYMCLFKEVKQEYSV